MSNDYFCTMLTEALPKTRIRFPFGIVKHPTVIISFANYRLLPSVLQLFGPLPRPPGFVKHNKNSRFFFRRLCTVHATHHKIACRWLSFACYVYLAVDIPIHRCGFFRLFSRNCVLRFFLCFRIFPLASINRTSIVFLPIPSSSFFVICYSCFAA